MGGHTVIGSRDSDYKRMFLQGAPKASTVEEVLTMVRGAMDAGAKGIAMGRKMWGSQDPIGLIKALSKIIREGADVNQALALLKH